MAHRDDERRRQRLRYFERRYRLAVAWFPDGRHLLVLRNLRWAIVTSTGGSPRDPDVPGWGDTPCVFSDGKRVAFMMGRQNDEKAILVGRVGGGPAGLERITPWQSMADRIDCSPDGARIVFGIPPLRLPLLERLRHRRRRHRAARAPHDQGAGVNKGANSWSPDGTRIAFASNRRPDGVFMLPNPDVRRG